MFAVSNQGRCAKEWSWRNEPFLKLCKCNIEGSHVPRCLVGSKYLEENGNKYSQIWTSRLSNTFPGWISEMGNELRQLLCQMTDTFFFNFHKMTWLQLRYTENSARSHQCEMKPSRRHSAPSFPELITEGRPFVYMSLPLFIFTIACTFCASHPLFVWLAFFPPWYSFKGEYSLKWNHTSRLQPLTIYDYKDGQKHIFSLSRSCCSPVGIFLSHFQAWYIFKSNTTGGIFAKHKM